MKAQQKQPKTEERRAFENLLGHFVCENPSRRSKKYYLRKLLSIMCFIPHLVVVHIPVTVMLIAMDNYQRTSTRHSSAFFYNTN
jgi:hypothetical protein